MIVGARAELAHWPLVWAHLQKLIVDLGSAMSVWVSFELLVVA